MLPSIAICIPVRDERRNLPGLFAALAAQRDAAAVLVIVLDGCRDGSEAIAEGCAAMRGLALRTLALPWSPRPDAGRARGAALSFGREIVGKDGLLLTTDADTRPAADWAAASAAALHDADVVCGHIQRRRAAGDRWRDPIEDYLDRLHAVHRAIDPVAGDTAPSHWHEGGASIGLTARAWDRIVGTPLPPTGEDRAMVRQARLAGLVVRQDPKVRVMTSSRTRGRAAGGLADALRMGRVEASDGREPMMEHPDDVIARVRRSATARAGFPPADPSALAARIGIAAADVHAAIAQATSADAFATALPLTAKPHRAVPLSEASRLLGRYEQVASGRAA